MNRVKQRSVSEGIVVLSAAIFLFLAGCAATGFKTPIEQAQSVEQKAYAIYGTYVATQERAASVVRSGRLKRIYILRIKQADKLAKPAADAVLELTTDVIATRKLLKTDKSKTAKLEILVDSLNNAITDMKPKLTALVKAVEQVRK